VCVSVCACIFVRGTTTDVAAIGLGTAMKKREGVYVCVCVYICAWYSPDVAAHILSSAMKKREGVYVCVCVCVCVCVFMRSTASDVAARGLGTMGWLRLVGSLKV